MLRVALGHMRGWAATPFVDEERRSVGNDALPRFRSRFGGLWTDLNIAPVLARGKHATGRISSEELVKLMSWIENGFVIIEGAVPIAAIDRLNEDIERAWSGAFDVRVEHWGPRGARFPRAAPELRGEVTKLLDLHACSQAARDVAFSPRVRGFVELVFERPAVAIQSLTFMQGSKQDMHQDTAYVPVSSPMEMCASWVALEDIQPNSGELEYYEGSHRMEEHLFEGRYKRMPPSSPEHASYLRSLHDKARRHGLKRSRFRPKKGDALVWAADLAHGGSPPERPGMSRRSFVTHYCPSDLSPLYLLEGRGTRLRDASGFEYCCEQRG
jgi:hypothetical protein